MNVFILTFPWITSKPSGNQLVDSMKFSQNRTHINLNNWMNNKSSCTRWTPTHNTNTHQYTPTQNRHSTHSINVIWYHY